MKKGIKKSTSSSATATALMCLALMATMAICANGEISCMEAIQTMGPCTNFFSGWGPDLPPIPCCVAASILSGSAASPEARKAVCECFRNLHMSPQALYRISRLRQTCAVGLPISSDPKQNCSDLR